MMLGKRESATTLSNAAASAGWDLHVKSVIPGVDDQVYKQAIKVG